MKRILWTLLAVSILIGCSSQLNEPNPTSSPLLPISTKPLPPQQLPTPTQPIYIEAPQEKPTMPEIPQVSPSSDLNDLVEKATQDLSQRLPIEASQIKLLEAKEVVWSNASLGCPRPGMVYADVLTPGYLIRLSANNIEFEYHASKGTQLIYCANPQPPASGTPGDT